jgi:acetyl-CoA carboxylase carboxyltransferase component
MHGRGGTRVKFGKHIEELQRRRQKAMAMGSPKKLSEWAANGIMNARQRLDYLLDSNSFAELGMLAVSLRPEVRDKSPGDGAVEGYGTIDGRPVVVHASDFSAIGASSAQVGPSKARHTRAIAERNGIPLVLLGECSGGRIPDLIGAQALHGQGELFNLYRLRQSPWVSVITGLSYGSSTWHSAMADFVVMRKGAVMAVSSPNVTSVAISENLDPEELGGWEMQTSVTGQVDLALDTDEECLDAVKRFLSYFPSNANEAPPVHSVAPGSGADADKILDILPEERTKVYDVRKIIKLIVDKDSYFPVKERFAKVVTTCLARLSGRSVGIIATNPMFQGGALGPDACDKCISFIVMCDSFNIPIITLADTPGFLVGAAGERLKLPGKIMNYVQALTMATVPRLSVIMRKSFGQAHINMGAGHCDEMAAWYTAEVSFMDPEVAVNIVYRVRPQDDPARFRELAIGMSGATGAYDLADNFSVQSVIDPRETRDWLCRMLDMHSRKLTGGIGRHLMQTWPTTF